MSLENDKQGHNIHQIQTSRNALEVDLYSLLFFLSKYDSLLLFTHRCPRCPTKYLSCNSQVKGDDDIWNLQDQQCCMFCPLDAEDQSLTITKYIQSELILVSYLCSRVLCSGSRGWFTRHRRHSGYLLQKPIVLSSFTHLRFILPCPCSSVPPTQAL